MTIVEFLLARIAEDEGREVDEQLRDLPVGVRERTAQAQAIRLKHRLSAVGWALVLAVPFRWVGFGRLGRIRAEVYADHPDFNEAWRP